MNTYTPDFPLTGDLRKRTLDALAETIKFMTRKQAYPVDLQKPDMIAKYRAHIAKLQAWLEA